MTDFFFDEQVAPLRKEWDKIEWATDYNFEFGFHAIVGQYGHPRRRYHDLRHLIECFDPRHKIDEVGSPDTVRLALFFHDYVYDPRRHGISTDSDEKKSAQALSLNVPMRLKDHAVGAAYDACNIIMMTEKHVLDPLIGRIREEAQLVLDCDISILGRSPRRYDEYEMTVRQEWEHVPDDVFKEARRQIMLGFIRRKPIYLTPHMQDLYEANARENIERWWK